ncbi:MAG: sensor histidine kinase [Spirochaetales bacterium]|nr:sensor histidine kinase [Spirochaetales bacterium]
MLSSFFSRRFQVHIFLSLLITGLIQVLLLGIFTVLFSSRLIDDTYSSQSEGRMELLVDEMNRIISSNREAVLRLSRNDKILSALFDRDYPDEEELSLLYQGLYRNLSGKIDDVSIHFLTSDGGRIFSTHVLPSRYNPREIEQSLTTYLKLKGDRDNFPVVDSFINPKGDRVGLSLFRVMDDESGQSGFLIADLNLVPLIEALEDINAGFFNNIYLIDNEDYKFVSLYREGEFGNFARLGWNSVPGERGIIKKDNQLIAYAPLYPEELTLAATLTMGTVAANLSLLTRMIFVISFIGLLLSSFMAYALARNITHPVTVLVGAMKEMESGNFAVQIGEFREDEFEILFHGFNSMSAQIGSLLESRVAREKELRTAERKALQSQINPHFLYNTLNTVKAISKLKGIEEITTIVTQLGKLLRDSIDSEEEFTTVGESLKLVEAYLSIQKIRYGESFNWEFLVKDSFRSLCLPRLIIQPIVENSVVHGLETLTGEKKILIDAFDEPLRITVSDNGGKLTEELWNKALGGNGGVGLKNIRNRLKLYYGEKGGLSFKREGDFSVVTIYFDSDPGGDL